MPTLDVCRVLPHQPEELFDIAADVERYPEFLPWWLSAKIRRRDGDVYYTDQVIGFGPVTQRFSTKTVLRRPKEIGVTATEGPFETFNLTWRFGAVEKVRCEVTIVGEIEFRAPLLGGVLSRAMGGAAGSIISAFEARARWLHDRHTW
jgi:coenzyme Q-binding protein COQ10